MRKIVLLAAFGLAFCAGPGAKAPVEIAKPKTRTTAADREGARPLIDRIYLERGMDVRVRTEGAEKTTLRLVWRAWDRPWVYREMQDLKFKNLLKAAGFKRVLFTENFVDEGWIWDLEKG